MKTNLRVMFLTLLILALSLFAEAKISCKFYNSASLFGLDKSYKGTVIFYTGKELNKKTWWKVWDEDYNEKTIYAVFNIDGKKHIVKTDMRYSSYYGAKFNQKYFDNIMVTKTDGLDQKGMKWYISWDFIEPYSPFKTNKKKYQNGVF